MGYLDKSGLSRLWSKIKSYVTNHHMDVSTSQSPSGLTILQFGDTWSNPNLYATGATDTYGHTTMKVRFPGFALPTVECGKITSNGTVTINFTKLKNTPKLIKVQFVALSSDFGHSRELCAVWCDGESVITTEGSILNVTQTGFTFSGYPGEHYWEAWG